MMKTIGRTGIAVAPLCLGGNVFGWTIDERTSFGVLDAFVAGGGNFIDTADVYSAWAPGNTGGESERIIGNWLAGRGKRDDVVIATKVGFKLAEGKEGLSAAYITRAVEDSLQRLQTDYIDLYQSHTDDQHVPLEETLSAYARLIEQGKVRAIGASNYTGARLQEALKVSASHGLPAYACLQPNFNYIDRQPYENDLQPVVEQHGLGVIPYFSLARGFLTGKYQPGAAIPKTARASGVQNSYFNDAGWAALKSVEHVASAHAATPAQVALAWLIARPDITAPIASATSASQVQELLGALQLDSAAMLAAL
jgi:aryl-alcohol dehydrogenase-like predicted oxidoreductase